jgi:hypothetical protein
MALIPFAAKIEEAKLSEQGAAFVHGSTDKICFKVASLGKNGCWAIAHGW